jgi:hypothetical protein
MSHPGPTGIQGVPGITKAHPLSVRRAAYAKEYFGMDKEAHVNPTPIRKGLPPNYDNYSPAPSNSWKVVLATLALAGACAGILYLKGRHDQR